jgi:hypothetical protein
LPETLVATVDISLGAADDRRVELNRRIDGRKHLFYAPGESLDNPTYQVDLFFGRHPSAVSLDSGLIRCSREGEAT